MKLDTITKIISIIHHLVWTIIGLSIIALAIFFISSGYKYLLNNSQAAQTSNKTTSLPTLSDKDLKCVENAIGKTRFDQIASGSGLKDLRLDPFFGASFFY
ncbi:hypothetical protein HYS03_00125 [Candidatus Woesebacteria bacterium]|nr:hypothetical protein [Candidatus Woesebacteria bacterium]